MTEGRPGPSVRRPPSGERARTDGRLLRRFARCRDEAAFTALVDRHGSIVLAVCRRVLANPHDAEDAWQAAFLLLARKAHTIRRRRSVRSWLCRVAYRVALEARGQIVRRQSQERPACPGEATAQDLEPRERVEGTAGLERREVQRAVREEVERLPEKYRTPVVLCYLEGKTNEQAAQMLGCPRGTILSRLARARDRLRKRLVSRGFAAACAALDFALREKRSK